MPRNIIDVKLTYHKREVNNLVSLHNITFSSPISPQLWRWLYIDNPAAPENPEIIVAIDTETGEIVGARPVLYTEMWVKNEKIKTLQPCETMVHPDYRRRGIFTRMLKFAIEYYKDKYKFFYNFPNNNSYPGYIKNGWRLISLTETLFRILNFKKVLSLKLGNSPLYKVSAPLSKIFTPKEIKIPNNKYNVEIFNKFSQELLDIDMLRNENKIEIVRNEKYLRWRFDTHPHHKYKYLILKKGENVKGYAVISVQKKNELNRGMIVDFLVENDSKDIFRSLMAHSIIELEKMGCDFISIWAFSHPQFRDLLLKDFDFKSSLKFPYNKFSTQGHFVARLLDNSLSKAVDIYDIKNWAITYAYADTT